MDSPIRVLHVIGIMNRGGAETMIMNLYRKIDRSKIQFDFVENTSEPAAFDDEIQALGGRIFRCPHYNGKNHFAYKRWWHTFFQTHRGEFPIVHGHLGSTAAIYLSIAKKYGAYTIAHSHSAGKGTVMYQIFAYRTRRVADSFFACSRNAAVSRYGKEIGNDKYRCQIINNAINIDQFHFNQEVREEIRQHYQITMDSFVVGHVGRFVGAKNHIFLVDIFEEIHKKKSDAVLLLVGDGERRAQIEAYIAEKNLQDYVILTGVQSNVWDYYQAMDVIVMPSLYEGLPVSLVEAQAAGLPCCVSTAVPKEAALTELVQFRSLTDSAEDWGDWVLRQSQVPRRDRKAELQTAGYDIFGTSKWLENYYTEVVNRCG